MYTSHLRLLIALWAVTCAFGAEFAKVDVSTAVGRAFVRMYEFDFAAAHAILDRLAERAEVFHLEGKSYRETHRRPAPKAAQP